MLISALLQPEFHEEMKRTRKTLEALPEGNAAFKPHMKSSALAKLAGHMAQMPSFISLILTSPPVDIGAIRMEPLIFETRPQILAAFEELADKALTDLKDASDEVFEEKWKLSFKGHAIFEGARYDGYRALGMNHLVHHRAQVGVYLRLLECPVPSIYGPSADNMS